MNKKWIKMTLFYCVMKGERLQNSQKFQNWSFNIPAGKGSKTFLAGKES